jgi:hypothetical protein
LNDIVRSLEIMDNPLGVSLVFQIRVLAMDLDQACDESFGRQALAGRQRLLGQLCLDGPLRHRPTSRDLALALTDQAQGHGLDPTR